MNLQTILIVAAVALLLGVGGGWKWRDYQAKADALEAANNALATVKTALVEHDKLSAADAEKSKTLEELLAAMSDTKPEVQIIREKEYVEKPVYRDCVLPPSGVQLLNGRIANRHPAGDTGKR